MLNKLMSRFLFWRTTVIEQITAKEKNTFSTQDLGGVRVIF